MPTLAPGCHLVPRWRMMMLPGMTASPPNFFTPRRLDSESRPLRDEPPAFLCAIGLLLQSSNLLVFRRGCSLLRRGLLGGLLGGFRFGGSLLRRLGATRQDFRNPDDGLVLTVAALATRILAATLLERDDGGGAALLDHFHGHGGAFNEGRADRGVLALAHGEDFGDFDDVASIAGDLADGDDVIGGNAILLATRFDDCEHFLPFAVRSGFKERSTRSSRLFVSLRGSFTSHAGQGPWRNCARVTERSGQVKVSHK